MIDISTMHMSSYSLLGSQHSVESAECAVNTVPSLASLPPPLSSVRQRFMGLFEGSFLETTTTLLSPGFFRNEFHCNQSPAADDHITNPLSAFREDSTQLNGDGHGRMPGHPDGVLIWSSDGTDSASGSLYGSP